MSISQKHTSLSTQEKCDGRELTEVVNSLPFLCNVGPFERSLIETDLVALGNANCGGHGRTVKSEGHFGETMKRIITTALLLLLASALSVPASAQIFMGPNSQKQAEKAARKEKKTELKNAKKQQKAMRKYAKRELKAEHRKH